jgi:hypothetical protein
MLKALLTIVGFVSFVCFLLYFPLRFLSGRGIKVESNSRAGRRVTKAGLAYSAVAVVLLIGGFSAQYFSPIAILVDWC